MENPKLYIGLLGHNPEGELTENHKVELTVAENREEAKEKLKAKWHTENVHVDGLKELIKVDGYKIKIEK